MGGGRRDVRWASQGARPILYRNGRMILAIL